jgi:mono/diheme cytochrome c family protein
VFRNLLKFCAVASAVAGLGCSGDGVGLGGTGDPLPPSGDGSGEVSFSVEIVPIFETHCTRCHAPGGIGYLGTGGDAADGLDLTAGAAYAGLVGAATFQSPQEPPRWRVLAGEPDSSYLVQKAVSDAPKAGARMPLDGPPFLSDGEIERIERWIEEGAADN